MNDGKEKYYCLIIANESGHPLVFTTRTDEDLIDKYVKCREDKFAYFTWNRGCMPMRNLLGVALQ